MGRRSAPGKHGQPGGHYQWNNTIEINGKNSHVAHEPETIPQVGQRLDIRAAQEQLAFGDLFPDPFPVKGLGVFIGQGSL
jgi:hypothetical protein